MVVLAGEEKGRPLAQEIGFERCRLAVELGRQLVVGRLLDELEGCQEIPGASLEASPQLDLGPQAVRLAEDLLGAALVVPEPGFAGLGLQLRRARFLGG